jgi:hypothetical protein
LDETTQAGFDEMNEAGVDETKEAGLDETKEGCGTKRMALARRRRLA